MAAIGDIVAVMTVTTSTAIMARLFVERHGAGRLMGVVGKGLMELAQRLKAESELEGYDDLVQYRGKILFQLRQDAEYIDNLMCIPGEALSRDRDGLQEMLNRIASSGWDMKPLSKLEFDYLQYWVGDGNWCRGIPYLKEE